MSGLLRAAAARSPVGLVLALVIFAAGCEERENPLDRSPEAIAPAMRDDPGSGSLQGTASLTPGRIGNTNVALPMLAGDRVTMRGGVYERQSPFRLVTLQDGFLEIGDFDDDGTADAAAVISVVEGAPTPGQLVTPVPHLVLFSGPQPLQKAVLQLPSGARIAEFRSIRGGIIELDLAVLRPGDRPCCPSGRETRRYRYSAGTFTPL